MPDLKFFFNLPPKKAIEYFKAKKPELSDQWTDLWQESHNKTFTVAKITKINILTDIQNEITRALEEGKTFEQFKKELEPRLKAKGWWGKIEDNEGNIIQAGTPWKLKTIYETNLQSSYQAGRYKAMIDNAESRPYWQYWAMEDSRTRPEHEALNGKVFRYDDPFWDSFYPPNGFNCRCKVRALNKRDIEKKGLIIESSDNALSEENKLVSKKSGIEVPVTIYKDPATGEQISPDIGWSYNPGQRDWESDLNKYPEELITYYLKDKPLKNIVNKINFSEISGWQEIIDNDTKKTEKIYNNAKLITTEDKDRWEQNYGKKIQEEYLYAKTKEELFTTYKEIKNEDLNPEALAYCIIGKKIGLSFETVEQIGTGDIFGCFTLAHEHAHAIGRNNFNNDTFKEEGFTNLNAVLHMNENYEINIEDLLNFLSKDSIDILLFLTLKYNGNKENIIKKIKHIRIFPKQVANFYTEKITSLNEEEFANKLKDMKEDWNILSKDEITNYLSKNEKEKIEIKGKLGLWLLKKKI